MYFIVAMFLIPYSQSFSISIAEQLCISVKDSMYLVTCTDWLSLSWQNYHIYMQINTLLACGGLAKNALYIQEHADITGKSLSSKK